MPDVVSSPNQRRLMQASGVNSRSESCRLQLLHEIMDSVAWCAGRDEQLSHWNPNGYLPSSSQLGVSTHSLGTAQLATIPKIPLLTAARAETAERTSP